MSGSQDNGLANGYVRDYIRHGAICVILVCPSLMFFILFVLGNGRANHGEV